MNAPFNYTTPDWAPLERAVAAAGLPRTECSSWMWMGEWQAGEHSYKHMLTRQYAVLSQDMDEQMAAARVQVARDDGGFGGSK